MIEQYKPIDVRQFAGDPAKLGRAVRLNSLGSLFSFARVTLKRNRMTERLHAPFCLSLERKHIKDVLEWPRDHYKSTICGEALPMWRTLPISQQDFDEFCMLGYSDEFLRWMMTIHNPDARNLLVSENITNAGKLGRRIRWHFESNDVFRSIFPEILPDSSCTWTDTSLHIKRLKGTTGGAHGEGTFDFMGVGSAAQSRHYNGIVIQDDLVGRKAIESQSIMDKTIDYHRLVAGLFENEDAVHENDELVVGNRWGYSDLNSHLMEHEGRSPDNPSGFTFTTHSALGGCCAAHPSDTPIFPEEFTLEKLLGYKRRLGAYNFSCQFLNNPCAPEDADFRIEWLNYYNLKTEIDGSHVIQPEVKDGVVLKDIKTKHLNIALATDPNHSGATGRARHAILVLGLDSEGNFYLLETWAQAASFDTYFAKLYEIARRWSLRKIGFETIAAQKFAAYHINHLNRTSGWPLRIIELKGEVEAPDGTLSRKKEWRIRNVLLPIFEQSRFYVQRQHVEFINEYQTFPRGRYVDQLDTAAYMPQMLREPLTMANHYAMLQANIEGSQKLGKSYSTH